MTVNYTDIITTFILYQHKSRGYIGNNWMYIQKYLFISKIQKSANFYKIFICCFRYMLFGINQDVWVDFLHKKIRLPKGNRMILSFIRARDGIRTHEGLKKYDKTGGLRDALPYSTPYSTPIILNIEYSIFIPLE